MEIKSHGDRLAVLLRDALFSQRSEGLDALASSYPTGPRDRFETLQLIYSLHMDSLERVGEAARWQHHPAVAAVKSRLEAEWLAELDLVPVETEAAIDAISAMRALAARDRLPTIYHWLARDASWEEVVTFLAFEGGPDAGFDDLVAMCQLGLSGPAKVELAVNFWDELGNGDPQSVHTFLHDELVEAIGMPRIDSAAKPVSALARDALGGLLATNRWLQPEMLGALGLIELQAGPRCQLVLQALRRCGASARAMTFYQVHADVDPRHGKDWLEKAVAPLVAANPTWAHRILRGAQWRSSINSAFLDDMTRMMVPVTTAP